LAFSVGFLAMSAFIACARGIASANQTKHHTVPDGAVLNKTSQLEKAPTAVPSPLRLSQPYPVPDAAQIFELQFSTGAFSRFNEMLCNLVVGVFSKACFSTSYLLQPALSRPRAALLQARAVSQVLLALVLDFYARKRFTIRSSGDIGYTEVNTEQARRLLWCFIGKLALQVDVPFALTAHKLAALNTLSSSQKVLLIPAYLHRDGQAPVHSSQRNGFIFNLDAQDALVIVNRRGLETARALAFAFADSGYGPDCKIGAKTKLAPYVLVRQLLQGELRKVPLCPSDSQNVVARCRELVNRLAQALRLTQGGYQLTANAQEGHMKHYTSHIAIVQAAIAARQFLPMPKGRGFLGGFR
jgi:hypothetical protein